MVGFWWEIASIAGKSGGEFVDYLMEFGVNGFLLGA